VLQTGLSLAYGSLWRPPLNAGTLSRPREGRPGSLLKLMELTVHEVTKALDSLRRTRPIVIAAIDGAGGAGKSTLAATLAQSLGAAVVAGDDFYRVLAPAERLAVGPEGGYMRYFDWERLQAQVLQPLRSGHVARYERFDWGLQRLGAQVEVHASGVILVEGVYSFRPELRPFYDWSIFVEAPREERFTRMRARGQNNEGWIARWDASEQWYFTNALSRSDVDAVVLGAHAG
jgi:uridine kinase